MDRNTYLSILQEQIRTKRARPMVVKEMEDHIEDQKCALMAEGRTEAEAEEEAVREMGDPVEAGVALDRIHRPKMNWGVLAGILLISLAGFLLQAMIARTARPLSDGTGIWLLSVIGDGMRKQAVTIVIGIFIMILICWLDYSVIGKYSVVLWILANVILVGSIVAGPIVNGRPAHLIQASYLILPCYAGILYHFRGQGKNGLLKSGACLCIPLAILAYNFALVMIILIGFTAFVLLHVAIYKGWFGRERKKLYLYLWGAVFGLGLLCVFGRILLFDGSFLADYQLMRIDAWIHPGKYQEYNYMAKVVAEAAQEVKTGASWVAGNMIDTIKNDYCWLFLCKYLGTWPGILLTLLVIVFWGFLLRTVRKQKNQLGYMVSLACVLFLGIETILYMAMNFSMVPFGGLYMPFLSNGNSYLLITYLYMGILLSVCRNKDVVRN